jgi:hypothetical protein
VEIDMGTNSLAKIVIPVVVLSTGMAWVSQAVSSEPAEWSDNADTITMVQPSVMKYTGLAQAGSPVHDWIGLRLSGEHDYAIPYSVEVSGPLAREATRGLEALLDRIEPVPGFYREKAGGPRTMALGDASVQTSDPFVAIPMPSDPGTAGSTNSGTACGVLFGHPPAFANIEYEWKWMQTDTNENGIIDDQDQWGWHLTSYVVNFPEDAQSLDC